MQIPRRSILKFLVALPAISSWLAPGLASAQVVKLKATPQDVEGPYYPKTWAGEVDNDLTTLNGKKYAGGIPMALSGRVRGEDGSVLKDAMVEIWQIDDAGEYRHPDFGGEGPANRGFQGYGRMRTGDNGQYTFNTIKPIGYSGRPPHVHFKVIAAGHRTLTTEMYFAGDNVEGSLYQRLFGGFSKERDLLTVVPKISRSGAFERMDVVFEVVLERLA
jgi:protocatechuate 3,4-dioxygenase, beta subunit